MKNNWKKELKELIQKTACQIGKDDSLEDKEGFLEFVFKPFIQSLLDKQIEYERAICRQIFIDEVDWSEWGCSNEEAGEDFDLARKELTKLKENNE